MPTINYPDLFTSAEMTAAVNRLPLMPTLMAPYFEPISVRTTKIEFDETEGHIILIGDTERGTVPNDIGKSSKGKAIIIKTSHLTQTAHVRPEDIQDIRAFGTTEPISIATVINDKMQALKNNLNLTKEYHRLGAIKGQVFDADGKTVLYDIFDMFDVTKQTEIIDFGNASDDTTCIRNISSAIRKLEAGMGGNPYSRIECIVGAKFYDALTTSNAIAKYFYEWLARRDSFGDTDYRKRGFPFGGITFYEASQVVGGKTQVETDKGHLYPVGPGICKTFFAPADWDETVNTYGQPYYARIDKIERGRGSVIEVQSNPATICTFPKALIELSIA